MAKVTVQLYKNKDVQGVLLTQSHTIHGWESPAKAIREYADTIEEYSHRQDITWQTSTSLFKMVMENDVGVLEVEGDDFLAMMGQRDHQVKLVGNSVCRLLIAECTEEELEPFINNCIGLATAEPMVFNKG